MDKTIHNYITPENKIHEDASDTIKKISKQFKLTKKQLNKDKIKASSVMSWKDAI